MTQYEAVLWDVGGVLLDVETVRASHGRFVAWLVDEHELDVDETAALETWRSTVGEHFREREGTEFRAARDAYDRAIEVIVGEPVDREVWRPTFRSLLSDVVEANPGARETVARIAETGRHQGVVSDADHDEVEWLLDHLGVLEFFDAVTTSERVGRTKPDPAMFETALDRAGVPPERAIMVGDRYEHDMAGASRHGIATAAYGADDGPAVDYRLDDLRDLLDVLGVED